MYAVIESGGRQHRVQVGDVLRVDRLAAEVGSEVVFHRVLLVGSGSDVKVGSPTVEGAQVKASVVDHDRAKKILIYTYKRRQNSNRKQGGHRQAYTSVKIEAIEA
jgi:large subunit ribosomal protein L21